MDPVFANSSANISSTSFESDCHLPQFTSIHSISRAADQFLSAPNSSLISTSFNESYASSNADPLLSPSTHQGLLLNPNPSEQLTGQTHHQLHESSPNISSPDFITPSVIAITLPKIENVFSSTTFTIPSPHTPINQPTLGSLPSSPAIYSPCCPIHTPNSPISPSEIKSPHSSESSQGNCSLPSSTKSASYITSYPNKTQVHQQLIQYKTSSNVKSQSLLQGQTATFDSDQLCPNLSLKFQSLQSSNINQYSASKCLMQTTALYPPESQPENCIKVSGPRSNLMSAHPSAHNSFRAEDNKRRRRRESHNMIERRRRDTINDRIHELSKLLPPHRLNEVNKNSKLVTNNIIFLSNENSNPVSPLESSILSNPVSPSDPFYSDTLVYDNHPDNNSDTHTKAKRHSLSSFSQTPRSLFTHKNLVQPSEHVRNTLDLNPDANITQEENPFVQQQHKIPLQCQQQSLPAAKGKILTTAVTWTRDLLWMLHRTLQNESNLKKLLYDHGIPAPLIRDEDESFMRQELDVLWRAIHSDFGCTDNTELERDLFTSVHDTHKLNHSDRQTFISQGNEMSLADPKDNKLILKLPWKYSRSFNMDVKNSPGTTNIHCHLETTRLESPKAGSTQSHCPQYTTVLTFGKESKVSREFTDRSSKNPDASGLNNII